MVRTSQTDSQIPQTVAPITPSPRSVSLTDFESEASSLGTSRSGDRDLSRGVKSKTSDFNFDEERSVETSGKITDPTGKSKSGGRKRPQPEESEPDSGKSAPRGIRGTQDTGSSDIKATSKKTNKDAFKTVRKDPRRGNDDYDEGDLPPQLQALPQSKEAARQAGIPDEVIGDAYVMTAADFPNSVSDRAIPQGRPAPAARALPGRRVSRSAVQNIEVQADLRLIEAALQRLRNQGRTAQIVEIRIDQTQTTTAGQRAGTNRPDLQLTIVGVEVNGRRVYIEYDRSPPTRAIDHAQRIISNDPDAIVILKVVDYEIQPVEIEPRQVGFEPPGE
jgi:hypothetical protein